MNPNVDKLPGEADKIDMFIGKKVLELLCEPDLKATAAQVTNFRNGVKVLAATADPELCQVLETDFRF